MVVNRPSADSYKGHGHDLPPARLATTSSFRSEV